MQYINKKNNREEGNQVTLAYLKEIRIDEEQRYPIDYEGSFRDLPSRQNSYYKQMTKVLLVNQHHYCCYCMRRLTGNKDTTLEHIIPQAADEEMLEYYCNGVFPMLSKEHMKLSRVFSKETNPDLAIYPHTVCYDNLVASCYGTFPVTKRNELIETSGHCCNNARGVGKAFPLYFFEDVSSIILYNRNGAIVANQDSQWHTKANELITSAKLTWKSLTDIRALWYVLRNVKLNEIVELGKDSKSREDLIQDNLYLTDFSDERIKELKNKFVKDEYWESFLLYDWFHSIKWEVE